MEQPQAASMRVAIRAVFRMALRGELMVVFSLPRERCVQKGNS